MASNLDKAIKALNRVHADTMAAAVPPKGANAGLRQAIAGLKQVHTAKMTAAKKGAGR